MNDEHGKEILDENTSNFQGQKSLTYEFSTLDETVKEEVGVKLSLCNLKLRNLNRLIFGEININSIRNKLELLFSLVSNNIDVLLISETKIDNTFPGVNFVYLDTWYHSDLTRQETEELLCYMLRNIYL